MKSGIGYVLNSLTWMGVLYLLMSGGLLKLVKYSRSLTLLISVVTIGIFYHIYKTDKKEVS